MATASQLETDLRFLLQANGRKSVNNLDEAEHRLLTQLRDQAQENKDTIPMIVRLLEDLNLDPLHYQPFRGSITEWVTHLAYPDRPLNTPEIASVWYDGKSAPLIPVDFKRSEEVDVYIQNAQFAGFTEAHGVVLEQVGVKRVRILDASGTPLTSSYVPLNSVILGRVTTSNTDARNVFLLVCLIAVVAVVGHQVSRF